MKAQELAADLVAARIAAHIGFDLKSPHAYLGGGGVLALSAVDMLRRTKSVLSTGIEQPFVSDTHPTLKQRLLNLGSLRYDPRNVEAAQNTRNNFERIMQEIWTLILPDLQQMHARSPYDGYRFRCTHSTHGVLVIHKSKPAMPIATTSRGFADVQTHREPRRPRQIDQRVDAEFVDAAPQQIVQAGLRQAQSPGGFRLADLPALDFRSHRNHQRRACPHIGRFRRGIFEGVPDAGKSLPCHCSIPGAVC